MKIYLSVDEIKDLIKDYIMENFAEQLGISRTDEIEMEDYNFFLTQSNLVIYKKQLKEGK